jgi:phosphate/sulfate permease
MTERNIALSQRESYTPSKFTQFLWWLATAEKEILIDSAVDRNRYSIIGTTVLVTWAFATLSWSYFFATVINSIVVAILLGLFMGFVILSIDRALIKGITKYNKRKFTPFLFRGLLAIAIGTFMAQPVVLYMFDSEIKMQTSLDNEKRKLTKRQQLDSLYSKRKNELLEQKAVIKSELQNKNEEVNKARGNFLAETDGSGGTGKVGIKDIAIAKRNEYQKLDESYNQFINENSPRLTTIETELTSIETAIKTEEAKFTQYLNNGFLTRIDALNNLLKGNTALQFRYYLIVFLLMLIELMPVIAKSLLPSGSYDEKVRLREEMEIEIANSNSKKEHQLKELYNQMAYEYDSKAIATFFRLSNDERNDKIKKYSQQWKDEKNETFDNFWEKMKKEILTKQEN